MINSDQYYILDNSTNLRKIKISKNSILICLNLDIYLQLKQINSGDKAKLLSLDKIQKIECNNAFLEWVYNLPRKKNARSILEILSFNDKSMWWIGFLSQKKKNKTNVYIYFENYFKLKNVLNKISGPCTYIGLDDNFYRVYSPLFRSHGVELIQKKIKNNDVSLLRSALVYYRKFFLLVKSQKYNKIYKCKQRAIDILILSDLYDIKNGKNLYLPNVGQELGKNGVNVEFFYFNNNLIDLSVPNKYKNYLSISVSALFEILFHNIKWLYGYFRYIRCETFAFHEIDLSHIVKSDIKRIVYGKGAYDLLEILMIESLLKNVKPKVVLYRKEFNSFGRKITMTKPVNPVVKMAFQHGVVNSSQLGYLHWPGEILSKPTYETNYVQCTPVPDILLLFGKRLYDHMTKFSYPEERLRIIGSLRHDIFLKNSGNLNNNILLIGQWERQLYKWTKMIVHAMITKKVESTLFIKPHPHINYNKSKLKQICNKIKFSIITSDIDTALSKCNIVATHSSTVGLEAILANKKVMVFDDEDLENDNILYKDSVIFDLIKTNEDIVNIFSGKSKKDMLNNYEELRKEYLRYNMCNDNSAISKLAELVKNEK
jgi:hypothetical protein